MRDFLSRLVSRGRGDFPSVRPLAAPLFHPGPALPEAPVEAEGEGMLSTESGERVSPPGPPTALLENRNPTLPEASRSPRPEAPRSEKILREPERKDSNPRIQPSFEQGSREVREDLRPPAPGDRVGGEKPIPLSRTPEALLPRSEVATPSDPTRRWDAPMEREEAPERRDLLVPTEPRRMVPLPSAPAVAGPVIRVTIGRVEVKAVAPAPVRSASPQAAPEKAPRVTLEDYLKPRKGRP